MLLAARVAATLAVASASPDNPRMHWEYKTMALAAHGWLGGKLDYEKFEGMLNRLGKEGWELVNVFDTNQSHGSTRDVVAVFKRAAR